MTAYTVVTIPPALFAGQNATLYGLVANEEASGGLPATSTVMAVYQYLGSAQSSAAARNAL